MTRRSPVFHDALHAVSVPRGVTLIELMVAVVVVGILAGIALPSFQNSVRKARRADAVDGASAVLQAQERWRANNPTYTATMSDLGASSTTTGGYYTLALASHTATAYTLTITPVSGKGQSNDTGCSEMTVTVASGNPTYAPSACWSR